ncbi:hypothetical protein [Shewanella surugensis]|uniref:Uncharacterized protein n=1 Tax=Shewanella surugensis TaxID=212020 RepID=A0ABT0LEU9_9GAMM|nr:hypothetical protein [Shewanella surugensis]MCL1126227.1 hypothetical protein [Shewanella surugensis]
MKKLLAACLITLVSFSALSGSGGRTGYIDLIGKKLQLISDTESTSRLYVYDVTFEGGECSKKTTGVLYFSDFLAKEMYSMLLAAKASNKRVELIANDCVTISGNTVPKITSIYLE